MSFWDWESKHEVVQIDDRGGTIHVFKARKNKTVYTVVQKYWTDKDGIVQPGKGCTIPDDMAGEVADLIMKIDGVKERTPKGRK